MPKQSPELNTRASIEHVAKELGGIVEELNRHVGTLAGLPLQRFWGGSKSSRVTGIRCLRTLRDEIRNAVTDMVFEQSREALSGLSVEDENGVYYPYITPEKTTKRKPADKAKKSAKPKK